MPIFQLTDDLVFPPVHLAEREGILAVGGDLTVERLLLAYRSGIFPWYSEGQPILWWSPDPRCILFPDDLKISDSMSRILKSNRFRITFDQDFPAVIENCSSTKRKDQEGTWITRDMIDAYIALHQKGFAHSVEVYEKDALVGGLYGISLGKAFFGESMFSHVSNASKTGFISLVQCLKSLNFDLIDCQLPTGHLKSLGAVETPREAFMGRLGRSLTAETTMGNWGNMPPAKP